MSFLPSYIESRGESTKKAFLNAKAADSNWAEAYSDYTPVLKTSKRYFVINTDVFEDKDSALIWLEKYFKNDFPNEKFRKNTAGVVIIKDNNFLFFSLS